MTEEQSQYLVFNWDDAHFALTDNELAQLKQMCEKISEYRRIVYSEDNGFLVIPERYCHFNKQSHLRS